jgi:hypothetical protein
MWSHIRLTSFEFFALPLHFSAENISDVYATHSHLDIVGTICIHNTDSSQKFSYLLNSTITAKIHFTMSSYDILSDLVPIETFGSSTPRTRPQQQVDKSDLASLPPLPSTDNVTELQEVTPHDALDAANVSLGEIYNLYQGTVEYFYPDRRGTFIVAYCPRTSRAEVLFTLEYYYYLHKLLNRIPRPDSRIRRGYSLYAFLPNLSL